MHVAASGSLGASGRTRWLAGLVAVGVLLMCALMAPAAGDAAPSETSMAGMSMSSTVPGADGATATDDCGTLCPTGVGATCLLLVALGTVAALWFLLVRPRGAGRPTRRRRPTGLLPRVARAAFRAPPNPWVLCVMRC